MQREWQRNQHLNFSHNNQLFLKPTPRQAREVVGRSLPLAAGLDLNKIFYGVACVALGVFLAALYL